MFPEFVPDKVMWAMAVLATVAVMVSRAHADVSAHPTPGVHTSQYAVSIQVKQEAR
jgi:hypothetical protein